MYVLKHVIKCWSTISNKNKTESNFTELKHIKMKQNLFSKNLN